MIRFPKNNQLNGNMVSRTTKIFLKFCYFSVFTAFLACNSDAPKKVEQKNQITTSTSILEATTSKKRIVVFGDSLTAGYGLDDVNDAFPGVLQTMIDSLQLKYTVVNSGVSGETTAGGNNRIDWILS